MTSDFKDHFSTSAGDYSNYRPNYPDALFQYLASIAPTTEQAWDCATGSGQAAIALANHFDLIHATDASEKQIANTAQADNIHYTVAPAEASGLPDESVDLITVAQALHWFDIPAFAEEAKRVLGPRGILAIWTYNLLKIEPEIDASINDLYRNKVGPYWPPERKLVDDEYKNISLPFKRIESPNFEMTQHWNFSQLVGYIGTWSAVSEYKKQHNSDPFENVEDRLSNLWGNLKSTKHVIWPLTVILYVK